MSDRRCWWVSGWRYVGPDMEEQQIICAALMAADDDDARLEVASAHDDGEPVEFRFIEPRAADWSPFCERFPRADWMVWPPADGALGRQDGSAPSNVTNQEKA